MAYGDYNDILFYDESYLRANFSDWELSEYASVVDGKLVLPAGAYAKVQLSDSYMMASLEKSKYKKVHITTVDPNGAVDDTAAFNCTDSSGVKVIMYTRYSNNTSTYDETRVLSLNKINSEIFGVADNYEFIFPCLNMNLESCEFIIANDTDVELSISEASLYRSQDTTQLAENVVTQMTVASVTAYLDGMEIQFTSNANPIKCWWLEDQEGNFCGINVNNERRISFNRVNGSLS